MLMISDRFPNCMEIYKLSPNPEGEGQGNDVTGLGPDTWVLFIVRREVSRSRIHMILSNFNLKLI
jgi:hypothetical protein